MSGSSINTGQLAKGLIIVLVGVALLLARIDVFDLHEIWRFWPVILIVLGVSELFQQGRQPGSGWMTTFAGVVFLMHNFYILRLYRSWPLFVVAFGVSLIAEAIRRRQSLADSPKAGGEVKGEPL